MLVIGLLNNEIPLLSALRQDLFDEITSPGTPTYSPSDVYFGGSYDILWRRYDVATFDQFSKLLLQASLSNPTYTRKFLIILIIKLNNQSLTLFKACNVALFPLPSGSLYCRVRNSFWANFEDAKAYCKNSGFTGLAEARTKADGVRIAGINVCKWPSSFLEF